MTYTLGIGALLDGETFNIVRSLELQITGQTGNFGGLDQPPHITVKRPFTVDSSADIEQVQAVLGDICSRTNMFEVTFTGLGSFGESSLYMALQEPNRALSDLHASLLSRLSENYDAVRPFEGSQMVFHTSIATNLQNGEHATAVNSVNEHTAANVQTTVHRLGLFLGLANDSRWIVISEYTLRNKE